MALKKIRAYQNIAAGIAFAPLFLLWGGYLFIQAQYFAAFAVFVMGTAILYIMKVNIRWTDKKLANDPTGTPF